MSDTAGVTHLFDEATAKPALLHDEQPADPLTAQIAVIQRWRKILSVRWLVFIALIGALGVWGYSTIDPTPWRFGVSCAYSVLVLMPTFWLYHQRSE